MNDTEQTVDRMVELVRGLNARVTITDDSMRNLNELYGLIWCEACYDPSSARSQQFALKLLPFIQALNKELHFKK